MSNLLQRFVIFNALFLVFTTSLNAQDDYTRRPVLESYVTSPAIYGGFSPRQYLSIELLKDEVDLSGFEIISVHGDCYNCSGEDWDTIHDAMYLRVPEYADSMKLIGFTGFPQLLFDRTYLEEDTNVKTRVDVYNAYQKRQADCKVEVEATVDSVSRALEVKTKIKWRRNLLLPKNVVMVLTEDDVNNRVDEGYSQFNFYSKWWPPGINWDSLRVPMVVNGVDYYREFPRVHQKDMIHKHVARKILPSFGGETKVFPTLIEKDSIYSWEFQKFILPSDYNLSRLRAIVMVLDRSTYEVENSGGADIVLGEVDFVNKVVINEKPSLKIYPNPAKNFIQLYGISSTEEYRIYNNLGVEMLQGFASKNANKVNIQMLNRGVYFMRTGEQFLKFIKD
jgi:hypothetical protein